MEVAAEPQPIQFSKERKLRGLYGLTPQALYHLPIELACCCCILVRVVAVSVNSQMAKLQRL